MAEQRVGESFLRLPVLHGADRAGDVGYVRDVMSLVAELVEVGQDIRRVRLPEVEVVIARHESVLPSQSVGGLHRRKVAEPVERDPEGLRDAH